MVKKIVSIFILLFLLLLAGFYLFVLPQIEVMTSFAARNTCTAIFKSDRSVDHFSNLELQQSPLQWVDVDIDSQSKTVTTSVMGLKPKTAYATPCGCNFNKDTPSLVLLPLQTRQKITTCHLQNQRIVCYQK